LSEHEKGMIFSVVFALILVVSLAGASYYLLPPEGSPYPSAAPSATPSLIPTSTPISTPMPSSTSTPIPPSPSPTRPTFFPEIEVASLEGFDCTEMEYSVQPQVLVLHQGTSANITLNIYSYFNESLHVSLSLQPVMVSVNCEYPSTLDLPPYGRAISTIVLEAAADAPSNLYNPQLDINVDGYGSMGSGLGIHILVFPSTPSYIFHVFAQMEESPSPSPTLSPTPSPTPLPTPPATPLPTPIPTPPPGATPPPWPWQPELQVERGKGMQILFYIHTEVKNPSLSLNLTYQSGPLPAGINAHVTLNPLPSAAFQHLLLTITVDPETPEGTYEITAKGSVNQITYERVFHLKVTSSE